MYLSSLLQAKKWFSKAWRVNCVVQVFKNAVLTCALENRWCVCASSRCADCRLPEKDGQMMKAGSIVVHGGDDW